jgi:hypothetical protein
MSRKMETADKGLLAYRPDIRFIEPDVQPGEITPVSLPTQIEDIQDRRGRVKRLASAVNALATATQARVDEKAKGLVIKLDPAVAAMRAIYPNDNPLEITYDQYKNCKERMRLAGEALGKKASISPDEVEEALENASADAASASSSASSALVATGASTEDGVSSARAPAGPTGRSAAIGTFNQMGGYNTTDATNGGLRPELDQDARIVEPLDVGEFQDIMIKILINFLWKMFLKPAIPVPGLPNELVKVPKEYVGMLKGISVLGYSP